MNARLTILAFLAAWVGTTLVLSEVVWFRHRRLGARLAPHVPGSRATAHNTGLLSVASFREIVRPLAQTVGERLASVFGVSEDLGRRLDRIHSVETVGQFRVRQIGWASAGLATGSVVAVTVGAPPSLAILLVLGAPLLVFLIVEQHLASASHKWQQQIERELPVVAEQLGMLLGAGFSLGAAIARLAERGGGATSQDFVRLHRRTQQGVSTEQALREWEAIADLDAVHRLVGVLALNREAGDLGRLIGDEARTIRREAQRRQIEHIERRNQQVWIPVTVATLLPGVILLAVPFIDALSALSGS